MSEEMLDLETVIEDAVQDSMEPDTSPEVPDVQASEEPSSGLGIGEVPEEATAQDPATGQPAVQAQVKPAGEVDAFAKRHGLQPQSVAGRENRIPYSRVRAIVGKVEAELQKVQAQLQETQPKYQEYETKVRDYEERLTKVAQFEHALENDVPTVLNFLSQIPAWKPFFDYIEQLAQNAQGTKGQPNQPAEDKPILDFSTMPQPDQLLPDGSRVYSMKGLQARDEWMARQLRDQAVKEAEAFLASRIQPIEEERRTRQAYDEHMARVVPQIERQVAEARTWPNFTELEPEIIQMIKADRNLSLEGAYMRAYQKNIVPKLSADRNRVRTEVLSELQRQPKQTAAPVVPGQPRQEPTGPRDMDSVIREALAQQGIKVTT